MACTYGLIMSIYRADFDRKELEYDVIDMFAGYVEKNLFHRHAWSIGTWCRHILEAGLVIGPLTTSSDGGRLALNTHQRLESDDFSRQS